MATTPTPPGLSTFIQIDEQSTEQQFRENVNYALRYLQNTLGGLQDTVSTTSTASAVSGSTFAIGIIIDGGGSAITAGIKADLTVPFSCTITEVRLLGDQSGSTVLDIWKNTFGNFPPTSLNTITGKSIPTIVNGLSYSDTKLTGWNPTINAGDILRWNVNSSSGFNRLTAALTVTTQ